MLRTYTCIKGAVVIGLIAALSPAVAGMWAEPLQEGRPAQHADSPSEAQANGARLGVCPGEGSCYEANGTPGCNNAACCEAVCLIDPFCCDVEWDGQCANEALETCGGCGDPDSGNCFDPDGNGTPGCNNFWCCATVCVIDSFCCDVTWDSICADEALDLCGIPNCPGGGSCFEANGTHGCEDPICCNKVCLIDPICCILDWDETCADLAAKICHASPPCPWDLDRSGTVGASDLLSLLASWGPCKGCPADFDGNGTVGASDLLALLANWGVCP